MKVSVGVIAHNEEKGIGSLLNSLDGQAIDEIIVVSSSDDMTNDIVKKHNAILIAEKARTGKAQAINKFIRKAKNDILVLCSADIIIQNGSIEKLCEPFKNDRIGIVASKPVPHKSNTFLGDIIELQWMLHHELSLIKPKFGEMIAFRKVIYKIDATPVDEEYIGMMLMKKDYRAAYVPSAIVRNHGPKTISDFVIQRRRIFCGHLELWKKKYTTSSLDNWLVMRAAWNSYSIAKTHVFFTAMMLEGISRLLGYYDYLTGRNHCIWEIAETTKAR
jgi:poly-beta-1,6-N-acetyl-D-glucosamine synthase